jgi:hypothetical protein
MSESKPCTTALESGLLTVAGVIDKGKLPEIFRKRLDQRLDRANYSGKVFVIEDSKSSFNPTFLSNGVTIAAIRSASR